VATRAFHRLPGIAVDAYQYGRQAGPHNRKSAFAPKESTMSSFRFIPLALALMAASTLIACNTAPAVRMGAAPAHDMATHEKMARMDAQMKTMHEMHGKMMNARTPAERQALMADHMKAMQGGMDMMKDMHGMGAKHDPKAMAPEMAEHHKMMKHHMEMMQMMMNMMKQRMPS
jgi:hypothetical protein